MQYWLMKSEPDVFSIDDLAQQKVTLWEGVRNFQARNFMTNNMQIGDLILFYHSNATPPGIAGVARVHSLAAPDPTQFDPTSQYYDPRSTPEKPKWNCVKVEFVKKFKHYISLQELRAQKALKEMLVLKRGQRLSIQPVQLNEFLLIQKIGDPHGKNSHVL